MLLRSSSTPVLGSLLTSFSESQSPNNHHHYYHQPELTLTPNKHPPIPPCQKVSFHRQSFGFGSQNFTTFSCNSSPISPAISNSGFRRAQSEGNLESLASSVKNEEGDDFSFLIPPKKFSTRPKSSMLETIPSFSFHNTKIRYEEDEFSDEEEEEEEDDEYGDVVDNFVRIDMEKKMALNEEMRFVNEHGNAVLKEGVGEGSPHMYLARGLGVDTDLGVVGGGSSGAGGGGGNFTRIAFGKGGGGDSHDVEDHYKRMVNENPGNSLFLRNYAQFLYQSKKDFQGAEEYYSRAILADPNDGEIISQYAKILWELHHDKDRATSYFERAVQTASEDSHVHAAYASFLWETEEADDEDQAPMDSYQMPPLHHQGTIASATA